MIRRTLNVVTILSLLLAAVVLLQWYRGYRVQDSLSVQRVVGARENPIEDRFNVVTFVPKVVDPVRKVHNRNYRLPTPAPERSEGPDAFSA